MICLRCGNAKSIKEGNTFCDDCQERANFSKELQAGFDAALKRVVSPTFWDTIGEPLATQMKASAYLLYKIGFVDGVRELGSSVDKGK